MFSCTWQTAFCLVTLIWELILAVLSCSSFVTRINILNIDSRIMWSTDSSNARRIVAKQLAQDFSKADRRSGIWECHAGVWSGTEKFDVLATCIVTFFIL